MDFAEVIDPEKMILDYPGGSDLITWVLISRRQSQGRG